MKHSISRSFLVPLAAAGLFGLSSPAEAASQPGQTHSTDRELFLHGDFHGDGRAAPVIIDRETGLYRSAQREPDGTPIWMDARSTGLPAVESATAGKFRADGHEEFVATHPNANRLVFIRPVKSPVDAHPHRVASPAPGPIRIAAGRFDPGNKDGRSDLLLLSAHNPVAVGSPYRLEFFAFSEEDEVELKELDGMGIYLTRPGVLGPAAHPNFATDFSFIGGDGAILGRFSAYGLSEKGIETVTDYIGSAETRFETALLAAAPEPSILVWTQGEKTLQHFQLRDATGDSMLFELSEIDACDLEREIEMIRVLEEGTPGRILVVYSESNAAAVYEISDRCVGKEVDRFTAKDRDVILGAFPDGDGGFTLTTGPAGGPSTGFLDFKREADGRYSLRAEGELPRLDDRISFPNLIGFDANPFLAPEASPLDYYRYRDWVTTAFLKDGVVEAGGEEYLGESKGLGSYSVAKVGTRAPSVRYLLPNQVHDDVSVAPLARKGSRAPASIMVDPPGGTYDNTVRLSFSTTIPDATIYYRKSENSPWTAYKPTTPPTIIREATVQFYARSDSRPNQMTAVSSASYSFSRPFHEFDSNRDGLPDFVRDHFGLDPFGQPDTTGNGFTDLQEILAGTDPLDPDDYPETRLDLGAVFDAQVYPVYPDPDNWQGSPVSAAEETILRARDLNGTRHASGRVAGATGALGVAGAQLERLAPGDGRLFFSAATPSVFETHPGSDDWKGHEMLGLFPIPAVERPVIDYTPAGGSLEAEVDRWIAAAVEAIENHKRPVLEWRLTPESTFASAAFETRLAELVAERDPAVSTPEAHTLFPHRLGDANRERFTRAKVDRLTRPDPAHRELTHPLFDLKAAWSTLLDAVEADDARGSDIRKVVRAIYEARALHYQPETTVAPPPLDAFRHFLATEGDFPDFYEANVNLTALERAAAIAGVETILNEAFVQRTTESRVVEILNDTFDGLCRNVVDTATGQNLQLVDKEGKAYRFPAALRLPAGTQLDLSGFAGASPMTGCPEAGFEVLAVYLYLLPTPVGEDSDWNLLPDEWEKLHFGRLGIDPFGDAGGNGYSNLQSYFEGADPRMSGVIQGVPPLDLGPPQVRIQHQPDGRFELTWDYPEDYADRILFYYEKTDDLLTWTSLNPDNESQNGSGNFSAVVPGPTDPANDGRRFYRLRMGLR